MIPVNTTLLTFSTSYIVVNSEVGDVKLEISDELAAMAEGNVAVGKLSEERVQQLVYLMTSWTEVMQKEIRHVEDFKVKIKL